MTEHLQEKIVAYYTRYYRDTLGIPEWSALANARATEERDEERRVARLEKLTGALAGKRVLSVGCGTGGFTVVAAQHGAQVVGLDPDAEAVAIAQEKAQLEGLDPHHFVVGVAERLPFPDRSFDLVQCYTVLEHVQHVAGSIAEMLRVTKTDGVLYLHSPNYLRWYEGHYKLLWPPLLPKPLGRFYLRLRGRPSRFLDSLNYLTPRWVRRAAAAAGGMVEDHAEPGAVGTTGGAVARFAVLLERLFRVRPHIEVIIHHAHARP